jgi:hypothetical protein
MTSRLLPALLLATVVAAGCDGTPAEVCQKIAWFHTRANAHQYAEITREAVWVTDLEKFMQRRNTLGRMIGSTEAGVEDVSGYFRVITVHQNTEFERGYALETFRFRIDEKGLRLDSYHYQNGKRIRCPVIALSLAQCEIEDAPHVVNASRFHTSEVELGGPTSSRPWAAR